MDRRHGSPRRRRRRRNGGGGQSDAFLEWIGRGSGLALRARCLQAQFVGVEQYPEQWRDYRPIQPRGSDWRGLLRKLWAPLAAVGAFFAKFGLVLLKFKFLFSIFVSAAFYVWVGGWWFGIGLIMLLFVHEMGHVLEAKRQGLPVSVPVFIPFMGALITLRQMPHNAWREARLAIAGPIVGSLGALAL